MAVDIRYRAEAFKAGVESQTSAEVVILAPGEAHSA